MTYAIAPEIPQDLPPVPSLIEGVWLKGDWHLHTCHSTDTSNNPESKIIRFAEDKGFDYLAITDHDVHVQGDVANHTWADPEFHSDKLLLFYGAEVTAARGHFNVLATKPYDHQRMFDARDARDWNILKVKQELGVHLSANHPGGKNHYGFSFDLADSIEIWNTCIWEKNILSLQIWDDMLKSGRMLGARGGSDSHHGLPDRSEQAGPYSFERQANYVGTPTTWIFAASRTKEAILDALARGRASISANPNNPRVELIADLTGDGQADMMMGDNVKPNGGPVTFRVNLVDPIPNTRYFVRVIKNREPFAAYTLEPGQHSLCFSDVPAIDSYSYYRVEIEGPQTPYPQVPLSMSQSGAMVALSNPIYFNYDPEF